MLREAGECEGDREGKRIVPAADVDSAEFAERKGVSAWNEGSFGGERDANAKIIRSVATSDPETCISLMMMGVLTIITHVITDEINTSTAQSAASLSQSAAKTQATALVASQKTAMKSAERKQIVDIAVELLQLFSSGQGEVLDIFFTSGLINSAAMLLSLNNLWKRGNGVRRRRYVKAGIGCLINVYNNISSVPQNVVIDILFSLRIVLYLFNGISYCLFDKSNEVSTFPRFEGKAFQVASQLLELLLLYTKPTTPEYSSTIIRHSALNTIICSLTTVNSTIRPGARLVSFLDEYKLRVLRLMKNLHTLNHNMYDQNVLDFLLPLLNSPNPNLVEFDLDLLYFHFETTQLIGRLELAEYDTSYKIVVKAIHTDLVSILFPLLKHKNTAISTVSTFGSDFIFRKR